MKDNQSDRFKFDLNESNVDPHGELGPEELAERLASLKQAQTDLAAGLYIDLEVGAALLAAKYGFTID